jgi:hypothetical protein
LQAMPWLLSLVVSPLLLLLPKEPLYHPLKSLCSLPAYNLLTRWQYAWCFPWMASCCLAFPRGLLLLELMTEWCCWCDSSWLWAFSVWYFHSIQGPLEILWAKFLLQSLL